MKETRIIQRNLVYVVGILIEDADADYLKSNEMFGKYGVIEKVVLGNSNAARPQSLTTGVYSNSSPWLSVDISLLRMMKMLFIALRPWMDLTSKIIY